MLTRAARAEVVDNSSCFAELAGGVSSDIRAVGFLRAGSKHLYGCFVRVHDLLSDHHITQGVDQGLQLYEHYGFIRKGERPHPRRLGEMLLDMYKQVKIGKAWIVGLSCSHPSQAIIFDCLHLSQDMRLRVR